MESSSDNDSKQECISEGHLQFMRDYIRHEDERGKKTLERFLARRLNRMGKAAQSA